MQLDVSLWSKKNEKQNTNQLCVIIRVLEITYQRSPLLDYMMGDGWQEDGRLQTSFRNDEVLSALQSKTKAQLLSLFYERTDALYLKS